MALEKSLWKRVKGGLYALVMLGYKEHHTRIENSAVAGMPDVEFILDHVQVWLELKSVERPAKPSTPIRPKLRPAQSIWHTERAMAGCRTNFVLLQVGSASKARLYLIPGNRYDDIAAITEAELQEISVLTPEQSYGPMTKVLLKAKLGW